ncbi:TonB-dependent receptor, partial [Flavobacteriales bacterium]|nr:TonB-dependent receptor [Flavobacteriales bacterium]
FANTNIKAQNQIKGKVVEQIENGSEIPIPGANVYWEGTTIGVATNDKGFYSIPEPENYPATLVVSFVGYQEYSRLIKEKNYYHIVLSPSIELDAVEVQSKVNTTKFSTINTINMQTLSTSELEKAACCNLSESFGTNASVDVNFTDAVSGAKQIQMLGLDGVYAQVTQENMPLIRGISSTFGLNYVPGTWIESIQVIKGTGSVVNGFESLVGQINLEYFKPESAPKLFWNMYSNSEGKLENNLQFAKKEGNWKSNLFTHISYFDGEVDHNEDMFLDMPKVNQVNVLNRWEYKDRNYHIGFTARALTEGREGGTIEGVLNPYVVDIQNDLVEFTSKTGAIQPNFPGKSMGLQSSFRRHNQTAIFGKNDYKGLQESAYLNFIRQTYISNTNHILKYGMSYYADRYTESFSGYDFNAPFSDKVRVDLMSGVFSEYAFKIGENFNLVAGIRADYYNNTEEINYLPRINMKYNPTENTAIRFSAGRAFRIANLFVENASFLASTRKITLENLNPEIAWNYGTNLTYCFRFLGREGTINADAYRTVFENQVVVDIETSGKLSFYNLNGESISNSMQIDLGYELFNRFDMKMAYKINNVTTTFEGIEKVVPLIPKEHALFNIAYATNFEKWKFDVTANYIGSRRIPEHQLIEKYWAEPFYLYNAQITKRFRYFDVYLGGENILDYKQNTPILGTNNPNSTIFDASLIHAPINGCIIYVGFRYKIK